TGSLVYDSRTADFTFRQGPVVTNLMLDDEINRTPPKTQSALLEAMEERQVTVDGSTMPLPDPFMVIAIHTLVKYEDSCTLPEAQLARFLLKLLVPLPGREEEVEILTRHSQKFNPRNLTEAGLRAVASAADLHVAQGEVENVQAAPEVLGYIVDIVQATRTS